jgi:phosphonate transport system substrate-binding protein
VALRLLTYLAPSLPATLFEALAAHLGTELAEGVELRFDPTRSGPRPGESEPFTSGEVDLAFVCATSYVWLTSGATRAVELVGAAWVPTDPRAAGEARYFGDVLTTFDGPETLANLAGRRVAYNDEVSLSGYHSLRLALAAAGIAVADVALVRSGSHLRSLELLLGGEVDAAAIDSNVWRRRLRTDPAVGAGRLRPIAALGPHPVQPLVARAGLPPELTRAVRTACLLAHDSAAGPALRDAELARFVKVDDAHYASLRAELAELGCDGAVTA